jgi:hypothetical protein
LVPAAVRGGPPTLPLVPAAWGGMLLVRSVTLTDVDVAFNIWGKNIAALKGKTTRSKPIPVATDFVKIPKEILNLHRDVSLTADFLR